MDGRSGVCYHRLTEGTAVGAGRWGPALVIGIIALAADAAADEEYVI